MIKTISLGLGLLKGCLSVSLNRVFSRNLLCKTAWLDRSRIAYQKILQKFQTQPKPI